jgi:hypothetical protein
MIYRLQLPCFHSLHKRIRQFKKRKKSRARLSLTPLHQRQSSRIVVFFGNSTTTLQKSLVTSTCETRTVDEKYWLTSLLSIPPRWCPEFHPRIRHHCQQWKLEGTGETLVVPWKVWAKGSISLKLNANHVIDDVIRCLRILDDEHRIDWLID